VIAYSSIGQVGYILIAVAIGGQVGLTAAVLYTLVNSANKTLLFLSGAQSGRYAGLAFAIGAFSVAGVPPALGFWGKTALFRATIQDDSESGRIILTAIVVLGGLLSLLYMFQSYGRTYWHAPTAVVNRSEAARTGIVLVLALLVLISGLWPEPLLALSELAAATLIPGGR
jgi:multicomponent Na+:H+ antiporter subunit D